MRGQTGGDVRGLAGGRDRRGRPSFDVDVYAAENASALLSQPPRKSITTGLSAIVVSLQIQEDETPNYPRSRICYNHEFQLQKNRSTKTQPADL